MAINLGLVSDQQALAATGVSTLAIDLGTAFPIGAELGAGFGLAVSVAADIGDNDETYSVDIISSDAAALTNPTVVESFAIGGSRLFLGAEIFLPLKVGFPKQRYIGLRYNLGGTTPTVTITAWFTSRAVFELLAKLNTKNFVD